nr:polymorphic toxin type 24 domain-containing protein [Pseudomonas qingdaonensis]
MVPHLGGRHPGALFHHQARRREYRGSGKDHGNIARPNIKEATKNTRPDGRVFIDKGRVRHPVPDEYPKGE